jgi:hypothetical protein
LPDSFMCNQFKKIIKLIGISLTIYIANCECVVFNSINFRLYYKYLFKIINMLNPDELK